jgi:hypothetical protein
VTAPQTASYRIGQAFATGDIATIAGAIRDGFADNDLSSGDSDTTADADAADDGTQQAAA